MGSLKLTVGRRDMIWKEIQEAIETHKKQEIRDILFDGNKGMMDDLATIDSICKIHEDMTENWDRFLHNGKTAKEEWDERMKPIKASLDEFEKMQEIIKNAEKRSRVNNGWVR